MKKGLLSSVLALVLGPGLAAAQTAPPASPPPGGAPQKIALAPAADSKPVAPIPGEPLAACEPPPDLADCEPPPPSESPGEKCYKPYPTCLWFRGETLIWAIKHSDVPPLVTRGSPADVVPGALGQPGTQVLFGGQIENEERYGGRFTVGWWLSKEEIIGLEGSFLFLGPRSITFNDASAGLPILARPFQTDTGLENALFISNPLIQAGSIHVALSSKLYGVEANGRLEMWRHFCCHDSYRIDILAGFRYLELDEGLGITQQTTFLPTSGFAGTAVTTADQFDGRNFFYGGQVGIDAEFIREKWFLRLLGKVALGATTEVVGIQGNTQTTSPTGTVTTAPGGFLALPSNIGRNSRSEFAVLPELGVTVGYNVTRRVRLSVGYTALYLSNVVRPGDQVDRVINTSQFPALSGTATPSGPARPAFTFHDTDFWAQGVNLGLEFRY